MSSIIDALKKSDNNRTNESGANSNQIKFGKQSPPKSRRGFWLLVALLILIAAGVFAWTQGWHHSAIAQVKSWVGSDQTGSNLSTQLEPKSATKDIKQTTTEAAINPTTERNNKLTPPKPDEVKAKSLAADQVKTETEGDKPRQLEVIATRESSTEQQNTDDSQTDTNTEEEIVEVKTAGSSQTDEEPEKIENADLIAQQDRQDLEPTMKQDYLLIHQIDFEIRKNIPPFKLNIHIYDPDPENCMVILNGVKYAIGDSIEDLITVEEINLQGVVLQFEGVKFLIPK